MLRQTWDLLHFKAREKKRRRKPVLRWVVAILLLAGAFLIVKQLLFLTPYFADRTKMFREVTRQLSSVPDKAPVLERKNQYQRVINNLLRVLERNPLHEQACLLLGKAYWLRAGIEEDAAYRAVLVSKGIQYMRKGFALSPQSRFGEGHFILGELYFERGPDWYFEALTEYRQAKRLRFHGPEMAQKMARILLVKGEYGQAFKAWQSILAAGKTPEAWASAGTAAYFLGRTDQAEQYLNFAIEMYREAGSEELDPKFLVLSYYYLGRMYFDKKIYDVAEGHYRRALQLAPEDLQVLTASADLYREIRNTSGLRDMESRIKKLTAPAIPAGKKK
jgi:tetratricopeptide (TPR) repeat protein